MSMKWLPNALTIARCILAFFVGWIIYQAMAPTWAPFAWFTLVAATDFVDGYAARKLGAVSAFGAFLDPVADKLLVAISLLAICYRADWHWILLAPTIAIIARDLFVTLIRLRPRITLPVTRLAKWKTMFEMAGIGGYLAWLGWSQPAISWASIGLIAFAAVLSLYTGFLYVRAAAREA